MPRRNANKQISPGLGARVAGDVVDTGKARKRAILEPSRTPLVTSGIYRPCNRWRSNKPNLQRAVHLADRLPNLTKYNYARG